MIETRIRPAGLAWCLALCCVLVSLGASSVYAAETRAQVVWVVDGDTITVRIGDVKEKVRLIGIDTPETNDVRASWKEAAGRAKRYAIERVSRRTVTLVDDPLNQDRDEHGRLLRYVILDGGVDFNEEMIAKGYAWAYLRFRFERKARYREAQERAKSVRLGVWTLPEGPHRKTS